MSFQEANVYFLAHPVNPVSPPHGPAAGGERRERSCPLALLGQVGHLLSFPAIDSGQLAALAVHFTS